jgi:hypothetical protein
MNIYKRYFNVNLFFYVNKIMKFGILFFILILFQISLTDYSIKAQGNHSEYLLANDHLQISLDKNVPIIRNYLLKENDGILYGEVRNKLPKILVYQGEEEVEAIAENMLDVSYYSLHTNNNNNVLYQVEVNYQNETAIEFDLVYTLMNNGLNITYKNVIEHENFYLIHIKLPGLITVKADVDDKAKLAIPADAGRLIDVMLTEPYDYEYEIDWLNAILAAFAYNTKVIGIMDTESIENYSHLSVYESRGDKYGSLSMKLIHRKKEYRLDGFNHHIPVTHAKYLLKVQNSSTIEIFVVGDYDGDGKISWVDGTKLLRNNVNAVANPYYKNKSFVRAFIDRPPTSRDPTGTTEEIKFTEVLDRIKTFAAQTDSAAYVLYLLGWQFTGHDTGYPAVDIVNEALGGYDDLIYLIEEARKYNVNVTFHDNYDDAYEDSPAWDPDVIARDPNGKLMKGGEWEERQSYLISNYKYANNSCLDRVRSTLEKYPIQDAYFIDVLAGGFMGGRKYDYNLENPAGAEKNFKGKKMIIREFNKHGVDVATEDFAGFFVGHVGSFQKMIVHSNTYFEGEKEIPLLPFIYQGKTSYGMNVSRGQYLKTFLYGSRAERFTNINRVFTPADYILDHLPKQKLYGNMMKSYWKFGDLERVEYENGTIVEINIPADEYMVALGDGRVIAKNYTSFVPVEENVYMACSRDGGLLSYHVPREWTAEENIQVLKMNEDGSRNNIEFYISDRKIEFQTEPEAPYKIIYTK